MIIQHSILLLYFCTERATNSLSIELETDEVKAGAPEAASSRGDAAAVATIKASEVEDGGPRMDFAAAVVVDPRMVLEIEAGREEVETVEEVGVVEPEVEVWTLSGPPLVT